MDIDSEEPQAMTDEDIQQTVSDKDIQFIEHIHNGIQDDDSENGDSDEIVSDSVSHTTVSIFHI